MKRKAAEVEERVPLASRSSNLPKLVEYTEDDENLSYLVQHFPQSLSPGAQQQLELDEEQERQRDGERRLEEMRKPDEEPGEQLMNIPLPDELLLFVFSMLSFRQLNIAACVCTSWQKLALDPLLYKTVELAFPLHLKRRKLNKDATATWPNEEEDQQQCVFRPQRISKTGKRNEENVIRHLVRSRMSKTRVLSLGASTFKLRGSRITAPTIGEIARICGPSLLRLDISGCTLLRLDALSLISESCSRLEALDVSGCCGIFTSPHLGGVSFTLPKDEAEETVDEANPTKDDKKHDEGEGEEEEQAIRIKRRKTGHKKLRQKTNTYEPTNYRLALLETTAPLFSMLQEFSFEGVAVQVATFKTIIRELRCLRSLRMGSLGVPPTLFFNNNNDNNDSHFDAEELLPLLSLESFYSSFSTNVTYTSDEPSHLQHNFIKRLLVVLSEHNPAGLRRLRVLLKSVEQDFCDTIGLFENLEILGVSAGSTGGAFTFLRTDRLRKLVLMAPSFPSICHPQTVISKLIRDGGIHFPSRSSLAVLKIPSCDPELLAFIATEMPNLKALATEGVGTWENGEFDGLLASAFDLAVPDAAASQSSPSSVGALQPRHHPLVSFFDQCSKNLKSFSWRGWSRVMNDSALQGLGKNLGGHLRKLVLNECPGVTDQGLAALSATCRVLTDLELFSLGWRHLRGTSLHIPSLTSLTLFRCKGFRDESLGGIVARHPHLKTLLLRQCKVGAKTCKAVGDHTSLETLEMTSFKGRLTNAALAEVGRCRSLRVLSLINLSLIDTAGLQQMANQGCPSLQTLVVKNCTKLLWDNQRQTEKLLARFFHHRVAVSVES